MSLSDVLDSVMKCIFHLFLGHVFHRTFYQQKSFHNSANFSNEMKDEPFE